MKKIGLKTLLTAGFCLLPLLAHAGAGIDQFRRFLAETRTLKAEFAQTVIPANGRKTQQSVGSVAISRPGKLRWEIRKPFPQLLVGDGDKVWIHDPELRQVTVRKVGQAIGSSPAALLAGSNDLEKNFSLAEGGQADGLDWVEATPKSTDSGFDKLRLGFAGGELRAMQLNDNFGQTTWVRFSQIERNPAIPASQFKFTPPAGTDVVGE